MHLGHSEGCDDRFPGGITNGAYWYNVKGESVNVIETYMLAISSEMVILRFGLPNKFGSNHLAMCYSIMSSCQCNFF